MGSLSPSGTKLTQPTNILRFSHHGRYVYQNNTLTDVQSKIANSGVIRTQGSGLAGVIFHPVGSTTHSSGMTLEQRTANVTSVNREKFTRDGTSSGLLSHDVERQLGIHVSTSYRSASGSLGPMVTVEERKTFPSGWTIFDGSGNAVGATNGITDRDITPTGVYGV